MNYAELDPEPRLSEPTGQEGAPQFTPQQIHEAMTSEPMRRIGFLPDHAFFKALGEALGLPPARARVEEGSVND